MTIHNGNKQHTNCSTHVLIYVLTSSNHRLKWRVPNLWGSCRPLLKGLISNPGAGPGVGVPDTVLAGRRQGRPAGPVTKGIQQPSRPAVAGSGSYGPRNNLNFLATWGPGVGGNPIRRTDVPGWLPACPPARRPVELSDGMSFFSNGS